MSFKDLETIEAIIIFLGVCASLKVKKIMSISYKNNTLHIENMSALNLAREVGTPLYCYSLNTIRANYKQYAENIPHSLICYAVKANSNVAILKAIGAMGGGVDVVSEGEMRRAFKAEIPAEKIVFSGIGKTRGEIEFALDHKIYQINAESMEELALINQIASEKNMPAVPVALRVNPNIDAKTNEKITTGLKKNKFGIPQEYAEKIRAGTFSNLSILGVSVHVGSQISKLDIFFEIIKKIKDIVAKLIENGHPISRIDLGGGLGISYADDDVFPSIKDYSKLLRENVCDLGFQIICEPGRSIVGNAGLLLSKVLYTKQNEIVKHVIIDAGMNDLIRPALYDSKHRIIPVVKNETLPKEKVDIVGPICESDDIFLRQYQLQKLNCGDLISICDVGAYGASMSSTYNSRPLIPEVLINNDKCCVIRKRGLYDELINQDIVSDWIY